MDSEALILAKNMLTYDSKDLDTIFDACEEPALLMLSQYASSEEMSNYITSTSLTYTSAELGNFSYTTLLTVPNALLYKKGNMIEIENDLQLTKIYAGNFVVLSVDNDLNKIEIYKTFTVDESGTIINKSLKNLTYAHAYMILYKLAIHSQSIVKGEVIYSSQQFGQGTLAPSSMTEKKFLADRYLAEALTFINRKTMVVI